MLHAHGITHARPLMSYHFHYYPLTDRLLALLRHPANKTLGWLILLAAAHSAHKSRARYWPFLSKSAADIEWSNAEFAAQRIWPCF